MLPEAQHPHDRRNKHNLCDRNAHRRYHDHRTAHCHYDGKGRLRWDFWYRRFKRRFRNRWNIRDNGNEWHFWKQWDFGFFRNGRHQRQGRNGCWHFWNFGRQWHFGHFRRGWHVWHKWRFRNKRNIWVKRVWNIWNERKRNFWYEWIGYFWNKRGCRNFRHKRRSRNQRHLWRGRNKWNFRGGRNKWYVKHWNIRDFRNRRIRNFRNFRKKPYTEGSVGS
jgi:hypothetical protein